MDLSESVTTARQTVEQTIASPDLAAVFDAPPGSCNLAGTSVGVFSSAAIHILDPSGDVVCSSAEDAPENASFSGEDWVQTVAGSGLTTSTPFTDPLSSSRAVAVAGPIVDESNEFAGSFAVVLRVENLAEALENTRTDRDSIDVTVLDLTSGEILSSTEVAGASGRPVESTSLRELGAGAVDGLDGDPRLYGTSTLDELDWQVLVGWSEEGALTSAQNLLWRRSGSALVILLFLVVLVAFIHRRITRPIAELSSGIRVAGENPDPEPLEIDGPAEVVHLANEYNSMIQTRANHERRLVQAQKMDAVGQVAGGIAHDFNNLLAAIISYAHLLGDQLRGDPRKDDADQIVSAAERGTALIRRLLTFSKRETENPRVVSVAAAVGASAKLLRQVLREDIVLDLDLDPDCWNVLIDPVQFEQVLINLVVNARDAMPQGGTITITSENRSGLEGPEMVALSVADSGEGIDPEVKDKIFEPFFTTKLHDRGTGLGLAVVKQIIAQAGGSIELTSERNVGTVVTIVLPREAGEEEVVEEQPPATATLVTTDQTILVVEDEEIVRDSTVRILQRHHFNVLSASSGTEALEVLAGGAKVDLLLTDLVMPDMSGTTLATQAGLPVLFMSGYADSQLRRSGLTMASHHIEKPFSPRDLVAAIETVMEETE